MVDPVYQRIIDSNPQIKRGIVWCQRCDRKVRINPYQTLSTRSWPQCCGFTMTVESPEERAEVAHGPAVSYSQQ